MSDAFHEIDIDQLRKQNEILLMLKAREAITVLSAVLNREAPPATFNEDWLQTQIAVALALLNLAGLGAPSSIVIFEDDEEMPITTEE